MLQRFPFIGVIFSQLISLILIKIIIQISHQNLQVSALIFFQASISAIITQLIFKLPKWFLAISLLFPILFFLAFYFFHLSSGIYAFLFLFFALSFSHTLKERVPLYLTNKKTHEALRKIGKDSKASSFLDLGSGLGGVVRAMAQTNITSIGVESAPLLWSFSALISKLSFKGKILRQNIWRTKLNDYDIVYAFLSPAIMDKLYQKVQSEMKAGSLFISNSFEVVGIVPDQVLELNDGRKTQLYFYRIKN